MTENLAGRGEGLAGLKLCPSCQAADNNGYTDANGIAMRACMRCMIQWRDLEAAAPAGTPDIHWAIKADCQRCRESYPQRHSKAGYISNFGNVEAGDWTHPTTAEHDQRYCQAAKIHEALFLAALATPSPQAPPILLQDFNAKSGFGVFVVTGEHQRTAFFTRAAAEQYLAQQDPERFRIVMYPKPQEPSNAFSTTSAREQSSVTASNKPSAAETVTWPPIPKYLLEPIVFRDANLGIAMVAFYRGEQWVLKVNKETWLTIRKVTAEDPLFIMETLNEPPAATQEQPAGSEAILRCMERHPEGGQCELRRGHARQHLAGMVMWASSSVPVGEQKQEEGV